MYYTLVRCHEDVLGSNHYVNATLTEWPLVSQTYTLRWLENIGVLFFLLNLVLFILNCVFITMRFIMVPGSFMHSFLDDVESLFIPSVVSFKPETHPWRE